jgi:alpha-beta hydrolase superfamily lysophospholipase
MQKRSEGHFTGVSGAQLYYQNWEEPEAVATLVMTHGMAEHSEAYEHLAAGLLKFKINLTCWDLRGHGKSDGKRGFVANFIDYVLDLGFFLKHLENQKKLKLPYFLGGHSLGGLILLRYLLENGAGQAKGVCLSSPLLGLSMPVPAIKDYASHLLNRFLPTMTLNNEIKFENLTHDKEILKSYYSDPFRHDKISSGVYLGMVENMQLLNSQGGPSIKAPLLMQVAGDDLIVSRQASEDFFKTIAAQDKTISIYEGFYHEIYNEIDRAKVFQDLASFIHSHLERPL